MNDQNHDIERQELIARILDGSESAEDRAAVERDPTLAAEIEDIRRMRRLATDAVDRAPVPSDLAASIATRIDRIEEDRDRRGSNNRFWITSMVASLAAAGLLWIGFGLFGTDEPSDHADVGTDTTGSEQVDPMLAERAAVDTLLQVGMTDHIRCAVKNFSKDVPTVSMEKMKMGIGEAYEMAVPVITEGIDEADVVVAHRCSFHGREYVHFVLKGENDLLMSVAITKKRPGETFENRALPSDTIVAGHTLYRTEIDGYEVAGFEAADHLVFVASTLSVERNLRSISRIVEPMAGVLREV